MLDIALRKLPGKAAIANRRKLNLDPVRCQAEVGVGLKFVGTRDCLRMKPDYELARLSQTILFDPLRHALDHLDLIGKEGGVIGAVENQPPFWIEPETLQILAARTKPAGVGEDIVERRAGLDHAFR